MPQNPPIKHRARVRIACQYADCFGVVKEVYETGRAKVRFYDPVLNGGCIRTLGFDLNRLTPIAK